METRDQWYKPNLLYNIHYRPPQKPEPPKMIVETVQFNPSVCTCGEHGCQPHYRMEKRVLWTNKEVCHEKKQSNVHDREKKNEYRESKFEERIGKQDKNIGSVIECKQMGLKDENDQAKEGDGNKCGSAESFKERMSGDVMVRCGYKVNYAVKENIEVNDNNNDEKEKEKKEECVCKNGLGYSGSKDKEDICFDEGARNTYNIKENNGNGISDRDNSEGRNYEGIYREKRIGNDSESALNIDCKLGERSSKKVQINKDQTTGDCGLAIDRDGIGDDEEYCSENGILINSFGETAGSCSIESDDGGLEDVEIASAFGIMSVYCNSELHN